MILADKIVSLRKKNGWSQEELAQKLNVSRQAVSKWEGAQTIPELEKILQMSRLFGVTMDYLLKDEKEREEYLSGAEADSLPEVKRVSMEEARGFLKWRENIASWRAAGFALVLAAPIPGFLIARGFWDGVEYHATPEGLTAGMLLLGVIWALAVMMIVFSFLKASSLKAIEEKEVELLYGVEGLVKEYRNAHERKLVRHHVVAAGLAVFGLACPLAMRTNCSTVFTGLAICLALWSVACWLLVRVWMREYACAVLLGEDERGNFVKGNEEGAGGRSIAVTCTIVFELLAAVILGILHYFSETYHWIRIYIFAALLLGYAVYLLVDTIEKRGMKKKGKVH